MTDKKRQMLVAARARFERFGFKKTTMDEVARDAGISKRTLYEIFKNKEDLFVSVFIREALHRRAELLERVEHIDGALEKLEAIIREAVGGLWQENFMIKVLKDEDGLYAPFLKEKYLLQVEEGMLNIFSELIKQGIEAGEIRPLDSHAASYFIFKLFQSVTYAKTASLASTEEGLEELIEFILKGIAIRV